jgi:MFS transporter, DHA2 family, multidrug resistance protein
VSGMLNLARNVGGSVGIAFFTTFIARQSQRHSDFLSAHTTPLDAAWNGTVQPLSRALVAAGSTAVDAATLAQARVFGELQRQAAVLSYVDLLVLMAYAAAIIAPLALLLRANPKGQAPSGMH